jgi:hypothetical protein
MKPNLKHIKDTLEIDYKCEKEGRKDRDPGFRPILLTRHSKEWNIRGKS